MDRYEKEYREFGPWILELKTDDDVPDLFRSCYKFDSSVECAVKIPIPLDRRQAEKGMDFYRSIVSFNKEEVVILEKAENGISTDVISYQSIKAFKNMIDLLEAELTLYTETKSCTIKYSSVSEDIMNRVIGILREKYIKESDHYNFSTEYRGKITDTLFRNLINDSNNKGAVTAVSFQETVPVKKDRLNIMDIVSLNFSLELQSYIFLKSEKELIAVNRNKEIKKRRAVDYSYNYTYIPFFNIKSAEFIPYPEFPDIYIFKISLKNSETLSFLCLKQTKTEFREIVSGLDREMFNQTDSSREEQSQTY